MLPVSNSWEFVVVLPAVKICGVCIFCLLRSCSLLELCPGSPEPMQLLFVCVLNLLAEVTNTTTSFYSRDKDFHLLFKLL